MNLEVSATAMASDGRAVARDGSGKVVFVQGALPGERVRAVVVEERARYVSARAVDVLDPSPDRSAPPCEGVAAGCGGCQWQHVALGAQHRFKARIVSDALRRIGRVETPEPEPTVTLEPWSFRTTLRAGIVAGRPALRRGGSHDLVDAGGCLVAHPLIAELLDSCSFHGATEVTLRCGARTGERLAATVPAGAACTLPPDVHRGHYHECAGGRRWRISAASFFQTRPDGADALAALVSEAAGAGGGRALDLYSGVGFFAGVLAEKGWSVTAVEGAASSVADARRNLESLGAKVVHADVTRWRPPAADLVVADPSRAGLGRAGVATVVASRAKQAVLVSCDAASLGRDAGLLAASGYLPVSVTPVDLFPHTFHVEVVTVFELRDPR